MNKSDAYTDFIYRLNAEGSERRFGYNPCLFEEIYEYERKEVEDIIWTHFNKGDFELAIYLPLLEEYDGVKALERKLVHCSKQSYGYFCILLALFKTTYCDKYFDALKEYYTFSDSKVEKRIFVSRIAQLANNEKIYGFLMQIYTEADDSILRSTAIQGILWEDGRLDNLDDMMELIAKMDLLKKFDSDSIDERRKNIEDYRTGQI